MALKAKIGPYSSVVGGSVLIQNEKGHVIGQMVPLCHDNTLRDRPLQERLLKVVEEAINKAELSV